MGVEPLKKLEKFLWIIFALLGLVAMTGLLLLLLSDRFDREESSELLNNGEKDYNWEEGLSDSTIWLPKNCSLYSKLPDISFEDKEGNVVHYDDFLGRPTVLLFWASWCNDCKQQMSLMKDYMHLAETYGDVQFIFLNRLDGSKETRASADAYFSELGLTVPCYYDLNEKVYETIGICNIPTMLFLDAEGRVISWSPKQITDEAVFESYLQILFHGNSKILEAFVTEQLMDENGGIHTEYMAGNVEAVKESAVLSESQGLIMEYAALTQNQELFDVALDYVNRVMRPDKLVSWCVEKGEVSNVNALIDDFRIYSALLQAEELWGGYEESIGSLQSALKEKVVTKNGYVDFYDLKNRQAADILTLCYIDLETMEALSASDRAFKKAESQAKELLLEGQISEEFPLYFCRYDYKEKAYSQDDLNMAEALVTLLHLAEADCLPENTHQWLKKEMAQGGIMARYNIEGEIVDGYQYESTAIYALLTLIGEELGDEELQDQALRKMEKMRVLNTSLPYHGAFGLEDGSGITSFDQLLPLLVYATLENGLK